MKLKSRHSKETLKKLEGKRLTYDTKDKELGIIKSIVVGINKHIGITVAANEDFGEYKKGQWVRCLVGPSAPNFPFEKTKKFMEEYMSDFDRFVDEILNLKKGENLQRWPGNEGTNENVCPYNQ